MKNLLFLFFILFFWQAVSAQLVKVNGATLFVESSAQIKINGGLTITSGSVVQNDGALTVSGDFQNSGSLSTTGVLELTGMANQQFDAGTASIATLDINKGGGIVNLAGNLIISGSLDISGSNNKMQLNKHNVIIDVGAVISGGNNTSYFITNDTGLLVQNSIGSSNRLFPVGISATSYNPARVRNFGTNDDYSVRVESAPNSIYTAGVASGSSIATPNEVDRVWIINEGIAGASNTTVVLQWDAAHEDASFNRAACATHSYSYSTGWGKNVPYTSAAVAGPSFTQTLSGITSFNKTPFGIASLGTALPVVWLNLNANFDEYNSQTHLEWGTASETDNDRFEVLRSDDNVNFTLAGTVQGKGTTLETQHYQFQDDVHGFVNRGVKLLYYRIKQVDYNGKLDYSSTKAVSLSVDAEDVKVYPNPTTGKVSLNVAAGSTVQFITHRGEEMMMRTYKDDILKVDLCEKGFYLVRIITPQGKLQVKKLLVY